MSDVIHQRSIDISITESGDSMIATGRLRDVRPWQQDESRRVLHDMTIVLEVDRTLTITGARVDMTAFPHAECPLVTARFGDLVGLSVARGYSRSLRGVFGGVTGCAHVLELARAAGAAIVQGSMSRFARKDARELDPTRTRAALSGTCHVWAADGPAFVKLDRGWHPGHDAYPAPPVDSFPAR